MQAKHGRTKMILAYEVGDRSGETAVEFMENPQAQLANRVQLTTDGHKSCLEAVEGASGGDVDYAQLVKLYGSLGDARNTARRYSPAECTGIIERRVERSNLSMRMGMRWFMRLTNAFSKKIENHLYMLALYFCHYNFVRIHKMLKVTPEMAAGVDSRLRDMEWIVGLIDARALEPKRLGPKPGSRYAKREKSN